MLPPPGRIEMPRQPQNTQVPSARQGIVDLWPGDGSAYFFFLAWERSDAIGPRSRFGVLGFRKSLPACEAVFFDVGMGYFSFGPV